MPRPPKKNGPTMVNTVTAAKMREISPSACNAQPPPAKLDFRLMLALAGVAGAALPEAAGAGALPVGWPQCGQADAVVETELPHSVHLTMAMCGDTFSVARRSGFA